MWTTVYMSQKSEESERMKMILESEGIIAKNKRVSSADEDSCYYEILVPSKEVSQAHSLIIDAEL